MEKLMKLTATKKHPVIPALLILAVTLAAMIAISPFDLDISRRLMDKGSLFGRLIQDWGTKPAMVWIVIAGTVLAHSPWRRQFRTLALAAAASILQFVIQSAILTNIIKMLSGRIRPIHLGRAGAEFHAFWQFAPGTGDFSFPSGHTATAMILSPVVIILWRSGHRRLAAVIGTVVATWALTVAAGRVVFGAHFATDVLFSIGLGLALAPMTAALGMAALRATDKDANQLAR